jgi:hypothetical protein
MRTYTRRAYWRWVALTAAGTTFILSGCDPQLQTTVENGIISLSTGLLTSVMRALLELWQESTAATARLLTDFAPVIA